MIKTLLNITNNIYNKTINICNKTISFFKNIFYKKDEDNLNYSIIKTNYGYNISFDAQKEINLKYVDEKLLINKAVIRTANIKDTSLKYTRSITISKKSTIIKNSNDYNKFINNALNNITLFYENMQENYEDVDITDITFKAIDIKNEK